MSQHTQPDINVHIGGQLKKRRKSLKLSQTQLGEILGITYQQVQKYESGANKISPERLFDLSQALDTSLDYFFLGFNELDGFVETKPHQDTLHILVSPEKAHMLDMYDQLPTEVKRNIRELMEEVVASRRS